MEIKSLSSGGGPGRFTNLLYGVLICAVLVGLVWLFSGAVLGSRDSSPAAGSVASDSSSDRGMSDTASADPSLASAADDKRALRRAVLTNCREVFHSQAAPLHTASTAMAQWQVHIGAMNQLVLGAISLQQATEFWNQTRVGARAHLDAFRAAVAPLTQPSVLCPAPPRAAASSGKVVRCERAVAARFDVLRSARVALATWKMHVMHMEMLRDGKMSAQQAEALWLQSWHEGQQESTRYRDAVEAARDSHC